jgi:PAS domain S-box-containing protein
MVEEPTEKQSADSRRPERLGILGELTQRPQDVREADAINQSHAQRLAAIVESSTDAIISNDLNGIVATWNKGAEKLFGYEADEVVGRPISILFPPELLNEEALILARIKRGERIEHYETVRQRKEGTRIQISMTVSPIRDTVGQVVGAAKIARDIGLRKRAEEAQALYDFTDRLFRAVSTDDIYEAALDAIIRALGCERASILRIDTTDVMKFVAWRGLSDPYRQAVDGHSPWTRDSKDPQPIFVSDIEAAELDTSLRAIIKAEGIAALAFIPLTTKGELIGKFMTYYSAAHVFTEAEINVAVTIARQLGFALERMRAEVERQSAEHAKEMLLNESRHRIKNTLATVQAIARQTLRHTKQDELQTFLARLHALAEAHELLTTKNWNQVQLQDVVGRVLKPFESGQQNCFVTAGPPVWLPANTSLSLTLCLHELATNAVKYGALSNGTGQVRVAWELAGEADKRRLRLTWQENGGPPVKVPERNGFGSLLIQSAGEGETCLDFRPEGLRCLLDLSF